MSSLSIPRKIAPTALCFKSIRYARLRAGPTQQELARRAGISQPALARIEGGRVTPRLDTVAKLLHELKAKLRGADVDLTFITFTTIAGNLDILGNPAGSGGHDALSRTATIMDLDEISVRVASLDDLILMKRAAGRPKDLVEIEILGAVREEIERER